VTAPESWTTASVYHFCHEFRRFVVDGIRKEVFAYVRAPLSPVAVDRRTPHIPSGKATINPEKFLDSNVTGTVRLRGLLETEFLDPILANVDRVDRGHGLGRHVPNSAILYGPPGTSKTELAKIVAEILGWPLLKLDPSHLTRDGLDRLHAETNLIFTMLASSERMVVLLDEFDELVQDRDQSKAESSSRFLTTAMLPKIAELATRRRIVYLLATNHIERFDDAISRAGRFDLVVPVMAPRLDEKLRSWPTVAGVIARRYSPDGMEDDLKDILADLTYLEFEQFAGMVTTPMSRKALTKAIRDAGDKATLRKTLSDDSSAPVVTWKSRVEDEARRNRLRHA
jgi:SpoVK/Ycf46/Vps4 family AAA+-type ATPase